MTKTKIPDPVVYARFLEERYQVAMQECAGAYKEYVRLGGDVHRLKQECRLAPDIMAVIRDVANGVLHIVAAGLPTRVRDAVKQFPPDEQEHLVLDGVDVVVDADSGDVLRIKLNSIDFAARMRCQVFGRARLRSVAEQRAWITEHPTPEKRVRREPSILTDPLRIVGLPSEMDFHLYESYYLKMLKIEAANTKKK